MTQSNPVEDTKGSCIDFDLIYKDENGAAEDVSDDVFTATDATPSVLANAVLTKTDPVNGTVHFHLDATNAAGLRLGNVNRVRIKRTFLDGCVEISEPIWVKII